MATKTLEVTLVNARKLFKALGSAAAKNWDAKDCTSRLKKLPGKLEAMNGEAKTDDLGAPQKKLLDQVRDAVENDLKIVVTGAVANDSDDAPAKKSSSKKTSAKKTSSKKAASVDDDDEPAPKKKSSKKSAAKGKHPGVIAFIRETLEGASKASPLKKEKILAKLVKKFADRDEEQMSRTLSTQLSRLEAKKNENGYWL